MAKEDEELKEIWSLFNDNTVTDKRKQVQEQYQQKYDANAFPDHLSITTAFDEILSCFSLGGQLKHYYRYGSYSLCENQREKFWFSIANGTFSQERQAPKPSDSEKEIERRHRIQEFYKKRILEQKASGSSEDVWDVRTELLEKPFQEGRDN